MFSSIFLKSFCWIHLKLDLQAHWRYFCRCVKDRPQRPKFLDLQMSKKFRFWNILLKNFLWIPIILALYGHWSYFHRCVQYGPQMPNFWAILGPKGSQNSGASLATFSKSFHLLQISIVSHVHCKDLWMCGVYGPQMPNFWAPK